MIWVCWSGDVMGLGLARRERTVLGGGGEGEGFPFWLRMDSLGDLDGEDGERL